MGAPLREMAEIAGRAGFGGVTVTPLMYLEARRAGATDREIRGWLDDAGTRVTMLDPLMSVLPGSPEPAEVGRTFRALFELTEQQCFDAAEALEVDRVNVAHYLARPTTRARLADSLGPLCDRAASRGIRILLEFMPEGSVPDLAAATDLVRDVARSNLSIMLDTWHFYRTGGTPQDLQGSRKGEIGGLQLSDATADIVGEPNAGLNRRLLPGRGAVPLTEIVGWVLASYHDPFVGVEVFNAELASGSPQDAAMAAAASIADLYQERSSGSTRSAKRFRSP